MNDLWYYGANNQQQGPLAEEELKKMFFNQQLSKETLVWKQGMENWAPAASVFDLEVPQPPPLTSAPPATYAKTTPTPATSPVSPSSSLPSPGLSSDSEKILALISYISVLFVISLLLGKDSSFVRFHAGQGLTLFLASILLGIVVGIMSFILVHIPFIGFFTGLGLNILYLVPFILMILGIINAVKGKREPLPLIGQYTLIK